MLVERRLTIAESGFLKSFPLTPWVSLKKFFFLHKLDGHGSLSGFEVGKAKSQCLLLKQQEALRFIVEINSKPL